VSIIFVFDPVSLVLSLFRTHSDVLSGRLLGAKLINQQQPESSRRKPSKPVPGPIPSLTKHAQISFQF
jgi:hypothetical protein